MNVMFNVTASGQGNTFNCCILLGKCNIIIFQMLII